MNINTVEPTTQKSITTLWNESYELSIGEILLENINSWAYEKYQKNRSVANWNALIVVLIKTNNELLEHTDDLSNKFLQLIKNIFSQLPTTNHQNNVLHSSYVQPEQIIQNKFDEWLMMNYIQSILEQQNPNHKIIIKQSSLQQDLGQWYDYTIQSNNITHKVDIKVRTLNSRNKVITKKNINYIYLTPQEFNLIKKEVIILLKHITVEQIQDINELNNIFKEYINNITKPADNNLAQYKISWREKPQKTKKTVFLSRKDRFKNSSAQ